VNDEMRADDAPDKEQQRIQQEMHGHLEPMLLEQSVGVHGNLGAEWRRDTGRAAGTHTSEDPILT
jgi:hypothetical protein